MSGHDRISELYRGKLWGEPEQRAARARIDWICARAGGRVLDIGCSQGIACLLLARAGQTVVGVDRDPQAIAYAQDELSREPAEVQGRLRFLLTDAGAIPGAEGVFDSVVLGEILEHQDDPERLLLIARERLRPGGRVIITVPFGLHPDPDHRSTFYLSSLVEQVGRHFRVSEVAIAQKYILCVGVRSDEASEATALSADELLRLSEGALLEAERAYLERERALREKLEALRRQGAEKLEAAASEQKRAQAEIEKLRQKQRAGEEERRRLQASLGEREALLGQAREELERERRRAEEARRALERSRAELEKTQDLLGEERRRLESLGLKLRGALARSEEARQKVQTLSRDAERQRAEVVRLTQTLSGLRGGVRYRLGDALVSCFYQPRRVLSLPGNLLNLAREGWRRRRARRHARSGLLPLALTPRATPAASEKPQCAESAPAADDLLERLQRFLERVAQSDPAQPLVFMFSGTIFMQEKRANRPIRLTRALRARGAPVLFSYFRWDRQEPVPRDDDPLLLQSPIDRTLELIRLILERDFGRRQKLFVLSFPYPEVLRFLNECSAHGWVTYYDVRDDWEEFSRVGMARWYDRACERYALSNCDLASAVSEPLRRKMEALAGRPVRLSPNAYDPEFLKSGFPGEPGDKPAETILGYFGHLTDRWFDYPALFELACTRPEDRIELIGHGLPEGLTLPPNVSYRGFLSHEEICRVARRWRCGLIPFVPGKLAEAVDPIKIYEYLALGLPTAAVSMPQVESYPYTHLARTRAELPSAVERCLAERIDGARIRAFLEQNTWARRVEQILEWAFAAEIRPALRSLAVPPGGQA
ncbi:MAG: methyltransferase domain-containing protein [Myxococcales bacterium]|nr:methyltransferase domain-containing protein [Myxococcales bacterium]